jgi:hypothetical protein
MRPLNRLQPVRGVGAYQTFEISSPVATHFRPASCAEFGCRFYAEGWMVKVLPDSDDERLLRAGGRAWARIETTEDGFRRYVFEAGTPCLRAVEHRVSLQRPEIYTVWAGDWRAQIGEPYRHSHAADWVDQFANHQDRLARVASRG